MNNVLKQKVLKALIADAALNYAIFHFKQSIFVYSRNNFLRFEYFESLTETKKILQLLRTPKKRKRNQYPDSNVSNGLSN